MSKGKTLEENSLLKSTPHLLFLKNVTSTSERPDSLTYFSHIRQGEGVTSQPPFAADIM